MKLLKNTKEVTTKNTRQDIGMLMGFLECELDNRPEILNWAQVGDLKRLRSTLLNALADFSNQRTNDIEDALEDARIK